jgi:hypothetical protein
MTSYDASSRAHNRLAEKAAKVRAKQDEEVVKALMSTYQGRQYILSKLEAAHIFNTSFSRNALEMAFNEGERNQGLALLVDIMRVCPDQYTQMMREDNERQLARDSERSERDRKDANGGNRRSGAEAGGYDEGFDREGRYIGEGDDPRQPG